MRGALLVIVAVALLVDACSAAQEEPYRIAVVGAGIGGSAFSHFLSKRFGQASVTVFERNDHVCGRVHHETRPLSALVRQAGSVPDGRDRTVVLELGGTIYHEVNALIKGMVEETGLQPETGGSDERLGIWTGQRFGFASPASSQPLDQAVTAAGFFLRYGPLSVLQAHLLLDETVARYLGTYAGLTQGDAAYPTLGSFLRAMNAPRAPGSLLGQLSSALLAPAPLDMEAMVSRSLCDVLENDYGVAASYSREFASAVVRVQYNQNCSLNSLVGLVGLFPVVDDRCHRVDGGNMQLCERLLRRRPGLDVRLSTAVRTVVAQPDGRYLVDDELFDAVVLASPLEFSGVQFGGSPAMQQLNQLPRRAYQQTRVTMVVGEPDPAYFGVATLAELPDCILTVTSAAIPFTSMCVNRRLSPSSDPHWNLYKIFSEHELTDATLDALFTSWRLVLRKDWWAYPKLQPNSQLVDAHRFQLAPSLFYISAMETVMSTMETQALAALNVVNLIAVSLNKTTAKK